MKDIFTEEKKKITMEFLKLGLYNFLKRSMQTAVVDIHTVTQKLNAPADNHAELTLIARAIAITRYI